MRQIRWRQLTQPLHLLQTVAQVFLHLYSLVVNWTVHIRTQHVHRYTPLTLLALPPKITVFSTH